MIPIVLNCSLDAADADGICESQSAAGAGALDLDGVLVSGGVAVLTGAGMARQVVITSAGDDSGITFTITGTGPNGQSISETVAGPDTTTATTTNYFRTVTQVAVSGATASTVTVGTNGVGSSRIVQPDLHITPFNIGVGCEVTGTINYTVQHTFDEIGYGTDLTWFDHASIADESTDADGNYAFPVRGIRVEINSGTGSVKTTLIQAG